MLKSKIYYATVSDKNLYYVGSIAIDENIMQQANNGPAAQKCEIGNEIFILSYAMIYPVVEKLKPILVDIKNKG